MNVLHVQYKVTKEDAGMNKYIDALVTEINHATKNQDLAHLNSDKE